MNYQHSLLLLKFPWIRYLFVCPPHIWVRPFTHNFSEKSSRERNVSSVFTLFSCSLFLCNEELYIEENHSPQANHSKQVSDINKSSLSLVGESWFDFFWLFFRGSCSLEFAGLSVNVALWCPFDVREAALSARCTICSGFCDGFGDSATEKCVIEPVLLPIRTDLQVPIPPIVLPENGTWFWLVCLSPCSSLYLL